MRAALVALTLAAAVAIAGCGGSEDDAETPETDPFYGVVSPGALNASDFARMAEGGVGTYRVVLAWSSVETTEDVYNWAPFDAVYAELARNGIDPLTTVVGTPAAYAEVLTDPPTDDPDTFDAYADFLEEATARYGPGGEFWEQLEASEPELEPRPVTTWEIWNEPNTALFWTPVPDVGDYADLLKRSARIIRDSDPDATIMVGGMFATPQSDGAIVSYDFIDQLYSINGVPDAIDAVAIHPYSPDVDGVIEQLDRTREAIDDAGDDAGISITEMGWSSDPAGPSDQAKTPEQQAGLLRKSYSKMAENRDEWDLATAVWFSWSDSDGPVGECQWCEFSGLVDTDRDTKPAWEAYTELAGGSP